MALRNFLDWSDFALEEQALSLFKESVRDSLKFDFYGERDTFKAIALTNSQQLTNVEAIGLGAASKAGELGKVKKYKFKARVIDPNSPHMFLPDPCDLAAAGDVPAAVSAIQQHTDIIQIDATLSKQRVQRGDIVEIQLNKNVFCYDLQVGLFSKLLARDTNVSSLLRSIGCTAGLPNSFGDMAAARNPIKVVSDLSTLSTGGGPPIKALKTDDGGVAKINPGLGLWLSQLSNFLGNHKEADDKTLKIPILNIGSGQRSSREQGLIMKKYVWGAAGGKDGEGRKMINDTYGYPAAWMDPLISLFETDAGDQAIEDYIVEMQKSGMLLKGHCSGRGVDIMTGHLSLDQIKILMQQAEAVNNSYSGGGGSCMEPSGPKYWKNHCSSSRLKPVQTRPSGGFPNEHLHIQIPSDPSFPPVIIPGVND
ncbi:hypothetical protein CMI37_00955 [Candidatus Pacearchaeota archaeon]|nr:hypothetical protein [Candidatus Pacearchaeota archaeon]|tara:strand:+ start:66 stop:1334 length:1269 start_codon:yes stop_codon:yes gene_type:complete